MLFNFDMRLERTFAASIFPSKARESSKREKYWLFSSFKSENTDSIAETDFSTASNFSDKLPW